MPWFQTKLTAVVPHFPLVMSLPRKSDSRVSIGQSQDSIETIWTGRIRDLDFVIRLPVAERASPTVLKLVVL